MPKLSQEVSTTPPSSTMPAGVCHIVIFSTSAHAQTPLSVQLSATPTGQHILFLLCLHVEQAESKKCLGEKIARFL
jgi:hypothetical protein